MGTIHHHIAVATTWRDNDPKVIAAFERVKEFALILNKDDGYGNYDRLLVGPVRGVANSYETYMVVPDGSKEGWSASDNGDELRAKFVEEMSPFADVFVGSFGELSTTGDLVNGDNQAY